MKKYLFFISGLVLLLSACLKTSFKEYSAVPRDCPSVTSVFPEKAKFGTTVKLIGSNFLLAEPSVYRISFNGSIVPISDIERLSQDTIEVVVPKGVESGLVTVNFEEDPCGSVVGAEFVYEYTVTVDEEPFAGTLQNSDCNGCLDNPTGVDVDQQGNVIVADRDNNVIRIYNSAGTQTEVVGELNDHDCVDDPFGPLARFAIPYDVAVNPVSGEIYVVDRGCPSIRKINIGSGADRPVIPFAGEKGIYNCNTQNGNIDDATFKNPRGIAFVSNDHVMTSDEFCHSVFFLNDNTGSFGFEQGTGVVGNGSEALSFPAGLDYFELNGARMLFVADRGNQRVVVKNQQISDVIAGLNGELTWPADVAYDGKKFVYIVDKESCLVLKADLQGNISPVAGSGDCGYGAGGQFPLIAQFNEPEGIAFDKNNNYIYIADTKNHIIRKLILE